MESGRRSTASKRRRRGEQSPGDLDKARQKKKIKSSDEVYSSKSKHVKSRSDRHKRRHTSGKHKKKHKIHHRHRKATHSSSSDSSDTDSDSTESSSDSGTSSSDSEEEARLRAKHKRRKKASHAKDIKKKSRHKPREVSDRATSSAVKPSSSKVTVPKQDTTVHTQSETKASSTKQRGPMTKEEWEKLQSVVRRVYDPDTGRHRLVRGSGEIIEEIVSKEQQKNINKLATMGDSMSFQQGLRKL